MQQSSNNTNNTNNALVVFWHAVQSAGVTAVLTLLIGLVQYVGLHGLNWTELGTTAALLFTGAFSMFYKSVSTNPNAGPALVEAISELRSSHSYLGGLIGQLYNAVVAGQAPPVAASQVQTLPQPQVVQQPFPVVPVAPASVVTQNSIPLAAISRGQVPPPTQ